jgi:hypothetical protein
MYRRQEAYLLLVNSIFPLQGDKAFAKPNDRVAEQISV